MSLSKKLISLLLTAALIIGVVPCVVSADDAIGFSLGDAYAAPGGTLSVPLYVSNASNCIDGVLIFGYDPAKLTYSGCRLNTSAGSEFTDENLTYVDGPASHYTGREGMAYVSLSFFTVRNAIDDSDACFMNLSFTAADAASGTADIELICSYLDVNGSSVTPTVSGATVTFAAASAASDFTYSTDGEGKLHVTGYTGAGTENLTVPAVNGETRVDCIDSFASSSSALAAVKAVFVPASVTSIDPAFWNNFPALEYIATTESGPYYFAEDGVIYKADADSGVVSVEHYPAARKNAVFHAADELTVLGAGKLNNSSVTSVSLGSAVTAIDDGAFADVPNLSSITVDPDNKSYKVDNGILKTFDGKKIVACPAKSGLSSYDVPSEVTSIAASAFEDCENITVTFPVSVSSVGEKAFAPNTGVKLRVYFNSAACAFALANGFSAAAGNLEVFAPVLKSTSVTRCPKDAAGLTVSFTFNNTNITSVKSDEGVDLSFSVTGQNVVIPVSDTSKLSLGDRKITFTFDSGVTLDYSFKLAHSWDAGKITTPATCSAKGVRTYTCTICKDTKTGDVAVNANNHSWGEWVITTEPTESKEGSATAICTLDPSHSTTVKVPSHLYYWATTTVKEGGFLGMGGTDYYYKYCSNEGDKIIDKSTSAHSHSGTKYVATCAATYEHEGYTLTWYDGCKCASKSNITPKLEHKWGEWTTVTPATCTAKGSEKRVCADCGETETRETDMIAHSWSDWTVTKEATVDAEGERARTCSVCKKTETETVPKVTEAPTEPTTEPTTAPTTEPTTAEPTTQPTTAEPTTQPTTAAPTLTDPTPVEGAGVIVNKEGKYILFNTQSASPADFTAKFANSGDLTVVSEDGSQLADDAVVATGSKTVVRNSNGVPADEYVNILMGDYDADGVVTAMDARSILRIAAKLDKCEDGSVLFIACDLDRSDTVNSIDARIALRIAAKLDKMPELS
ncbi:MAG: leucine-rich repeat protein [Clostridiales bacterium]|nr:leucine-rich repeat protein [Clostridiales bacterium]